MVGYSFAGWLFIEWLMNHLLAWFKQKSLCSETIPLTTLSVVLWSHANLNMETERELHCSAYELRGELRGAYRKMAGGEQGNSATASPRREN